MYGSENCHRQQSYTNREKDREEFSTTSTATTSAKTSDFCAVSKLSITESFVSAPTESKQIALTAGCSGNCSMRDSLSAGGSEGHLCGYGDDQSEDQEKIGRIPLSVRCHCQPLPAHYGSTSTTFSSESSNLTNSSFGGASGVRQLHHDQSSVASSSGVATMSSTDHLPMIDSAMVGSLSSSAHSPLPSRSSADDSTPTISTLSGGAIRLRRELGPLLGGAAYSLASSGSVLSNTAGSVAATAFSSLSLSTPASISSLSTPGPATADLENKYNLTPMHNADKTTVGVKCDANGLLVSHLQAHSTPSLIGTGTGASGGGNSSTLLRLFPVATDPLHLEKIWKNFRKLQLVSDSEGEREEEEEENIKPKKSKKFDNSNRCDFAAVKCCFDELDKHLPSEVESRPNRRTIGQHFEEWMRLLESGEFNILLHGLGSKRLILKQFGDFLTSRAHRIFVVDGLNPSDTVPKIIERMAEELKLKGVAKVKRKSVETAAEALRDCIDEQLADPLVLIVLNIDSPQLRSHVHQTAFSVLANPRNNAFSVLANERKVQLIASVDHVNAALIWDQPLRDAFAWLHYPISTYRCYENEVIADGTRLLGLDTKGNAKHTMSSLDVFWEATTSNMRKILTQLALHAPSKEKRGGMNALSIPKFCRILKDEFATSSETALRQQLIEFCDHQLVQVHKDGNIQLLVDRQLLNEFLVLKNGDVITSYSIHYTKLYDNTFFFM
uniref:Origin recognition complex subunit 2 n=1 Tax=Globodera pallida TaxID=36090 RepID=A0A183BXJ8_GLOPA